MLQDSLTPLNPVLHSIVSFLLEFFFFPASEIIQYPNHYGTDKSEFPSCWYSELAIQRKEVLIHNKSLNDYQCVNPVKDMNF